MNDNMLPIGTKLRDGLYVVEQQLGAGGFGNTYMVRNTAFDELFAMKEFFMKGVNLRDGLRVTVSVPDNHASFDSQREKFRKEALRLRKLRNAHIVTVHDLFEANDTFYYVMDYIDGESLAAMLKRQRCPFTEEEVRQWLPQILDALAEVHSQHIWHLDIKPGNIMVDKKGTLFLIDFGASKQMRGSDGLSVSTSSAMCYTPGYAPIEQVDQAMDKFGPWTDFYALGATLYALLTNRQPPSLTGINEEGAFAFPQPVSRQMRELIRWLMDISRSRRPQSVDEIRQYLNERWEHDSSTEEDTTATAETKMAKQPVKRSLMARLWLGDGQRKRNYITTFFLCVFALLAIYCVVIGSILGFFGVLEATGHDSVVMWASYVLRGGPIAIAGLILLAGIIGLCRWHRSAFWLMLMAQVLNSVHMIPDMTMCVSVSFVSLVVDVLILLLMQLPGRPVKGEPKQRGWMQCKPAPVAKWIALPLLVVWTLLLLMVPPIIGAHSGFKYSLYECGFDCISSDCGNYKASRSLASYYLDHNVYLNPETMPEENWQKIDRMRARMYLHRYFWQKPYGVTDYDNDEMERWLDWLDRH